MNGTTIASLPTQAVAITPSSELHGRLQAPSSAPATARSGRKPAVHEQANDVATSDSAVNTRTAGEQTAESLASIKLDRTLRLIILSAGLVVIALGLHAASPVLVPMLLAMCLVLAVQPLVEALEQLRASRSVAITSAMLTVLAGLGLFIGSLAYGIDQLISELPNYEAAAEKVKADLTAWLRSRGLGRVAVTVSAAQPTTLLLDGFVGFVRDVPALVGNGAFVLVLTLFMLLERNAFRRKLLGRVTWFARSNERIVLDVQHYLGVKTAVSVATGLIAGLWCYAWGVPNAILWGVTAFVLNYIPFVGSIVAAVPPIILMLLTKGVLEASAVAAGYATINLVIGNILEPRWLGKACGLSPLIVLISVVVWGAILGPAGAILSLPLTCAFRRSVSQYSDFKWLGTLMMNDAQPPSQQQPEPATRRTCSDSTIR